MSDISVKESLAVLKADVVHIDIFDIDGVFRHKQMDAGKAAKLAATGYKFCDVLYGWDSAEKTFSDLTPYIDRPEHDRPCQHAKISI